MFPTFWLLGSGGLHMRQGFSSGLVCAVMPSWGSHDLDVYRARNAAWKLVRNHAKGSRFPHQGTRMMSVLQILRPKSSQATDFPVDGLLTSGATSN